jgi:hypothetical protein
MVRVPCGRSSGRSTGEVEPPAAVGTAQHHRTLEGLGPEVVAEHLAHGVEGDAVVGAGHHGRDAAAVGQRTSHAVGQPDDAVDQHRRCGAGPVAGSVAGSRHDHDGILECGEGKAERRHGYSVVRESALIR